VGGLKGSRERPRIEGRGGRVEKYRKKLEQTKHVVEKQGAEGTAK